MSQKNVFLSWILSFALLGLCSCSPVDSGLKTILREKVTSTSTNLNPNQVSIVTSTPLVVESPSYTASATEEPSPTAIPSPSFIPTVYSAPTVTFEPNLPVEYFITNISGHRQFFPLGCETAVAIDWARYFGININEYEFQYHLPISDNPNYGFVGDVNGPWGQVPPYAYGVYAGPVATLLNDYGVTAKAYKNYTLEQLKAKIADNIPVITWVIGNMWGGIQATYTDLSGRTAIVAAYEHVVIVTGYDAENIRYMNNGEFYTIPTKNFLNSWGVLENMVIVDQ